MPKKPDGRERSLGTIGKMAQLFIPQTRALDTLREAAASCRGCELYRTATQTVFGRGSATSALMLVGEQPGDREDVEGLPFVGPAGKLLDRALEAAGIDREVAYVTNAVKHFKFVERGKRRIHAKPKVTEIRACAPWLDAEIDAVDPKLIVALGASASYALFGPRFALTERRGQIFEYGDTNLRRAIATAHPSAILRAPDPAARERDFEHLVADLRVAAEALAS